MAFLGGWKCIRLGPKIPALHLDINAARLLQSTPYRQLSPSWVDMAQGPEGRYVPSGVNAQSWLGFEQRIQERRFRALLDTINQAIAAGDAKELRRALLGHAGFFLGNLVRSTLRWGGSPVAGPTAVYYRKLARASARFALLTDLALLSLGGRLKFREKLSGRFADVLSWMYLGFCALRRFDAEGRREEDLPLVRWSVEHALSRIQTAFEGIHQNFPGPLRILIPRGRIGAPPSDRLGAEVADVLRRPGEQRDRLTHGLFVPSDEGEALARLERAFVLTWEDAPEAASSRADALQVDSFPPEEDSRPRQGTPPSVFLTV